MSSATDGSFCLADAVSRAQRQALACGALEPIETAVTTFEDAGMAAEVRWLASLNRKPRGGAPMSASDAHQQSGAEKPGTDASRQQSGAQAGQGANPFLPYDPNVFVRELSPTHTALLNKFPVRLGHLVLITTAYEPQSAALTLADFDAVAAVLGELEGLVFFNGGPLAGASQPHKHLQFLPTPLPPIAPLLNTATASGRVAALPYRHHFSPLPPGLFEERSNAAAALLAAYRAGCAALRLAGNPMPAYNLLLLRAGLLLVPRVAEHFVLPASAAQPGGQVSLNALSFAGLLFVRDPAWVAPLQEAGIARVLASVTAGEPR